MTIVHLHLRIEPDLPPTIEIEVHASTDTVTAKAFLDCLRLSYEEIGGEGFNARRERSRHTLSQETLDELQRLLPIGPLATPADASVTLAGTTYTLTIARGADIAEYTWSASPPAEWECLRAIVRLLVATAGVAASLDRQSRAHLGTRLDKGDAPRGAS